MGILPASGADFRILRDVPIASYDFRPLMDSPFPSPTKLHDRPKPTFSKLDDVTAHDARQCSANPDTASIFHYPPRDNGIWQ